MKVLEFTFSFIPFFIFRFLVTFGSKVTKIRKHYIIFFYILQGKMGKVGIPKTKRRKYEMKKEKSRTIRHFPLQIRFALSILPSVGKASKQTATRGAVMLSKAWEGQ